MHSQSASAQGTLEPRRARIRWESAGNYISSRVTEPAMRLHQKTQHVPACGFLAEAGTATCHRCSSPDGSGGNLKIQVAAGSVPSPAPKCRGKTPSQHCAYVELAGCKAHVDEVSSLRERPRLLEVLAPE